MGRCGLCPSAEHVLGRLDLRSRDTLGRRKGLRRICSQAVGCLSRPLFLGLLKLLSLLLRAPFNISSSPPFSLLVLLGLSLHISNKFGGSPWILLQTGELDVLVALGVGCDALGHDFLDVCPLLFFEPFNVAFKLGKLLASEWLDDWLSCND